jgi:hypothetical protein
MLRPVLQVVMMVKTIAAITRGNQPPLGILSRLAPQNPRSTTRNAAASARTAGRLHFHRERATTAKRIVVNTMSVVTATPYAAASRLDEPKPSTSPMQANMSSLLSAGM